MLLLLLLLPALCFSAPARKYPEVIPGPGMPSLESLGVTSEYLYNLAISKAGELTARDQNKDAQSRALQLKGECYTDYLAETYDALACYQYIYFLEHTQHQGLCGNFQNKGEWLQLASAGTAQVLAVTIAYWGSAIDQCGDVATGVWDVANTCGFGLDQGVEYLAGIAPAYGNGDFGVVVRNTSFPSGGKNYTLPPT